jgi:hypothetical protein
MELAMLTRAPNGHLIWNGFTEAALRAALFVDLSNAGRVGGRDAPWIQTTRTDFPPVDSVLREIDRHPKRTIDLWIGKGPRVQQALAKEWVRSGKWQNGAPWAVGRLRFYKCATDISTRADELRAQLTAMIRGETPGEPAEAGLAVLAQIAGLIDGTDEGGADIPGSDLIAASGPARWLIELAVDLVTTARRNPVTRIDNYGYLR